MYPDLYDLPDAETPYDYKKSRSRRARSSKQRSSTRSSTALSYRDMTRAEEHDFESPFYTYDSSYDSSYSSPQHEPIRSAPRYSSSHQVRECYTHDMRDRDVDTRSSGGSGEVTWVVPLVINTVLAGSLGFTSIGLATAGLRLTLSGLAFLAGTAATAATTAAPAVGATAGVVGTGYLTVKGGQLVITKARPGVIGTIRAANRAAGYLRAEARHVAEAIQQTVSHVVTEASETGAAVREIVVDVGAAGAAQLSTIYPGFPALFNTLVRESHQREIPVCFRFRDQSEVENNDSATEDITNASPVVTRNLDGTDIVMTELYMMTSAVLPQTDPAVETDGMNARVETTTQNSSGGLGASDGSDSWENIMVLPDQVDESGQDIGAVGRAEDPDLADVDWADEMASFRTAQSHL